VKGLEPSTTEATTRCSTKLSYTHHQSCCASCIRHSAQHVARQKGFEPLTHGLEGRCSVRLSYWRKIGASRFERPTPCSQGRCATRLRHAPNHVILNIRRREPQLSPNIGTSSDSTEQSIGRANDERISIPSYRKGSLGK
jgi:hypothetical protein